MNIRTMVVGTVLAATALTGMGAGIASASTPDNTPTGGSTAAYFDATDISSHYTLELLGSSDGGNANGTWDGPPPAGEILTQGNTAEMNLNTTGKTAAQGTVSFAVIDTKTDAAVGGFDATLGWLNDGSKLGQKTINVQPSTWIGIPHTMPTDVKVSTSGQDLQLLDPNQ